MTLCLLSIRVNLFSLVFFIRGLDEEIRTVVRGQTNIGHEGRQVCVTGLTFVSELKFGTTLVFCFEKLYTCQLFL